MRGCRGGVSPCAGPGGSPASPKTNRVTEQAPKAARVGNGTSALPLDFPLPAPLPKAWRRGFLHGKPHSTPPNAYAEGETAIAMMGGVER